MDYLSDKAKQILEDLKEDMTQEEQEWLTKYLSRQVLIAQRQIIEARNADKKWRLGDKFDLENMSEEERDQIAIDACKGRI